MFSGKQTCLWAVLFRLLLGQGSVGTCRMRWFSFLSQKLKAVTITTEAAATPALKWKTPTSVNVPGDLFCQKTTTLARVGQQNLPSSPCPPRECQKELLGFAVFSYSVLSSWINGAFLLITDHPKVRAWRCCSSIQAGQQPLGSVHTSDKFMLLELTFSMLQTSESQLKQSPPRVGLKRGMFFSTCAIPVSIPMPWSRALALILGAPAGPWNSAWNSI